jgi:hypothetical protein
MLQKCSSLVSPEVFAPLFLKVECLCIPRVEAKITETQIKNIFNKLNIFIIDHIDIIFKKEDKYKRVFIHIKKWLPTENANIALKRLNKNEDIKVIYDDPWFWKISTYKNAKKNKK